MRVSWRDQINKKVKNLILVFSALILFIIILFAPLRYYIYDYKFYEKLYESNGVYDVLDKDDVSILTYNTFDFFRHQRDYEPFGLKGNISYFDSGQISHMEDVRKVLDGTLITLYISIFLFSCLLLTLIFGKNLVKYFKNLSIIFLAASALMLGLVVVLYFFGNDFFTLFENFHHIFFPQGNWQFIEGSLIITIFPFGFFYDFFFNLLRSSFIIAIILFVSGLTGLLVLRKISQERKKP